MKLIDILVRDLHKFGGWPDGAVECHRFVDEANIDFYDEKENWDGDCYLTYGAEFAREAVIKRDPGSGIRSESVTREQYEAALAARKSEWDGNGLPPVGCECEYETTFHGWQPVRIELIKSEGIAFTWLANSEAYNGLDCVGVQKAGSFRPIRSEADKKRDEVGLALYHAINWNAEGELVSPARMEDYKKAYDAITAGKIPGVRIE